MKHPAYDVLDEKLALPNSIEALAWLRGRPNVARSLSGGSGDQAAIWNAEIRSLVRKFYDLGAVKVIALEIEDFDESGQQEEGHEDTDTLVVKLPRDAEKRRRIFELRSMFSTSRTQEPQPDTGQPYMIVWWE